MKGLGETDILLPIFGEVGRVHSVGLEQVSQDMYVLKTAVQTLAVEGHHSVGGITENNRTVLVVIGFCLEQSN